VSTGVAPRRVLLAATGLQIDGGIASVTRCIARALDEAIEGGRLDRLDRVLLLDEELPSPPRRGEQHLARGSKLRFARQVWQQVRRHGPDLVLVDHVGLARIFRLPAPGFPPPFGIFVHGGELEAARSGARHWGMRNATLLLTNSLFTASRVEALVPERAERIRPVLLCIDPAKVELWEARSRAQRAPVPRRPAALIVGRMWSSERGKGHDALVEAWPTVLRRCPAAELWIVGGGDDAARLEAKARETGVGERVRFLGRIPDAELGELYRSASVFAMPSRQEGFGLVYAEAMWHGTPCIGSTRDAAGEVIRDGETGLLVPHDDREALAAALGELLGDRERALHMGREARAYARTHFGYPRFRQDLLHAVGL
jgi:phosphatidylinositol alpha-1,6-mannosyltransferase